MELDVYFWLIVVGLPLLVLLLTGPGMWSEKWGWGSLRRFGRKPKSDKL